MSDAEQFVKEVGRQRLIERLGVSEQAVTNGISRGLPARWYAASKQLADEMGVECSPKMFGMIGVETEDTASKAAE
ncbi:MAG: hypothetical protein AAFN94_00740 [Pseudomonadota bacterium]